MREDRRVSMPLSHETAIFRFFRRSQRLGLVDGAFVHLTEISNPALFGLTNRLVDFADAVLTYVVFQRYMLAWDRHAAKLQRVSLRRTFSTRRRPGTPVGSASGSPNARIATYCAVQLPILRISSCAQKSLELGGLLIAWCGTQWR